MTSAALVETPTQQAIQFPDVEWCEVTKIGLKVKSKRFSFDDWESLRPKLDVMDKGSQWSYGDWLVVGEARHGEKTAQAIDAHDKTGVKVKTLMEYRRVSEKVPFSIRMESLDWSHGQVVAGLKSLEDRKRWLEVAAENEWKPADLSKAIRESASPAVNTTAEEDKDYLDPHYKTFLLDYIAAQYSFLNQCNYEPFKKEIERTIRLAKYQHKRTLTTDYEEVRDQVDKQAATPDEIMEEVPLSEDEVKRICKLIVDTEPTVYEWRKIGAASQLDNKHGSASLGIFRIDAPSYEPRMIGVDHEDWD